MAKPARPELKFNSFEEMLADVESLRGGPYEKAGKWDLGMIVDHLTRTMGSPFEAARIGNAPWPIGAVMRFFYCRFARREFYPEIKLPAPGFLAPKQEGDIVEMARVVEKVKTFSGATISCPPFGALPIEDFRRMQLLHGAHHLGFLKRRG